MKGRKRRRDRQQTTDRRVPEHAPKWMIKEQQHRKHRDGWNYRWPLRYGYGRWSLGFAGRRAGSGRSRVGRVCLCVCVCAVVGMGRRFGVGDGPHGGLAGVIVESCWSRARFESL